MKEAIKELIESIDAFTVRFPLDVTDEMEVSPEWERYAQAFENVKDLLKQDDEES